MRKVLLQLCLLIIVFSGTWLLLGRVDFMKHLHIEQMNKSVENRLGDLLMDGIRKNNNEITTDSVSEALDTIKSRICRANGIDPDDIHIHLIKSNVVNAFALPGNHIVVYTGLIRHCDSASELSGVLAHEISHLELRHVIKRLASELGIGVLGAVASNGNSAVIAHIIKLLSSTAFERKQESEADANGLIYLEQARIDPQGFINIMNKLADLQTGMPKQMEWISSHPDTRQRAVTIEKLAAAYHTQFMPVMRDDQWSFLKDASSYNNEGE